VILKLSFATKAHARAHLHMVSCS